MKKFLKIMGVVLCFAIIVPLILSIGNIFTPGSKGNGTDTSGGIGTGGSDMYTISASACSLTGAALSVNDDIRQAMTFTCNGVEMKGVTISDGKVSFYNDAGTYLAVDNGVVAEEYKVIEIGSSQNVSYEFYKWFMANVQLVAPIISAGTYYLSDSVDFSKDVSAEIEFQAGEYTCSKMIVADSQFSAGAPGFVYGTDTGWNYDVITILSNTQVTNDFYSWFNSFARKTEAKLIPAGYYKFNDSLVLNTIVSAKFKHEFHPSGTWNNFITVSSFGIDFNSSDFGYSTENGWVNGYNTIKVYENALVTSEFYNWFMSNASNVNRTISAGIYAFNDTIDCSKAVRADFEYSVLRADGRIDSDKNLYISGTSFRSDNGYIFYTSSGWSSNCQIIEISSDVIVSSDFYEWFTANAVQSEQLVAGTYKFNDTLEISTEFKQRLSCSFAHIEDSYGTYTFAFLENENGDMYLTPRPSVYYDQSEGWYVVPTITTTSSQYVSKAFFNWFIANTTVVIPEGGYEITPAA